MKEGEALFLYGDFNFRLDLQSVVKVALFTISVVVVFVFVYLDAISALLFILSYPIVGINHGLNGMGGWELVRCVLAMGCFSGRCYGHPQGPFC